MQVWPVLTGISKKGLPDSKFFSMVSAIVVVSNSRDYLSCFKLHYHVYTRMTFGIRDTH